MTGSAPADELAAVLAERFIRSHDTPTELRQFAYAVRNLARERDRLASLASEQTASLARAKADAWDEGREAEFNAGGRHAEPINPYRTALAGEQR